MTTVMFSPSTSPAVHQWSLSASTVYIIHPYRSWSLSKISNTFCLDHIPTTSHLSTHHCSVCWIPGIITHCSPWSIIKNLHSSRTRAGTIHQPQKSFDWRSISKICMNKKTCQWMPIMHYLYFNNILIHVKIFRVALWYTNMQMLLHTQYENEPEGI